MPRKLPIQDGRQLHVLHQGQQLHKVIDALSCYLKLFFHALQYARKFRFCLAHYANGENTDEEKGAIALTSFEILYEQKEYQKCSVLLGLISRMKLPEPIP